MKKLCFFIFTVSVLAVSGIFNFPHNIFAEGKYDIKEMTPEVKTALENRRSRFDELKNLKAQGIVGENNRGYVEVPGDDPSARNLVENENADRRIIYKTIEVQNNLSGALATIEKVFAQVQRDKANPGDKIQTEDGAWVTK
ncbi:MAG TPA: YdbL family protein [Candidatus Omnitrophota bacterium]|nr:YdbL family protein [Candidatus Omnitrophota bacterium]